MKNDPIEAAITALDDIDPLTPEGKKQLGKALGAKSNLVAAKAARIAGDALLLDLIPNLTAAFEKFLAKGSGADKGCMAQLAIARALVKLDCVDADLFRRGMKHIQMEGTWGGTEDRAAELRATCATGLANTHDPHALRDLVCLLVDPEWPARAGAVRAIAAIGSEASTLLLRYKALAGDREPDVVSQCVTALLEIEGAAALPLAIQLADAGDQETREAAIVALGISRRPDAIETLKQKFGNTADRDTKKCILLALASSRIEPALEFLLEIIAGESISVAELAISALSVVKDDLRVREAVKHAAQSRGDALRI